MEWSTRKGRREDRAEWKTERERDRGGEREREAKEQNVERRGGRRRGLGIASCTDEHEPSRNNAIRGQPCLMRARTSLVPSHTLSRAPKASTRA